MACRSSRTAQPRLITTASTAAPSGKHAATRLPNTARNSDENERDDSVLRSRCVGDSGVAYVVVQRRISGPGETDRGEPGNHVPLELLGDIAQPNDPVIGIEARAVEPHDQKGSFAREERGVVRRQVGQGPSHPGRAGDDAPISRKALSPSGEAGDGDPGYYDDCVACVRRGEIRRESHLNLGRLTGPGSIPGHVQDAIGPASKGHQDRQCDEPGDGNSATLSHDGLSQGAAAGSDAGKSFSVVRLRCRRGVRGRARIGTTSGG